MGDDDSKKKESEMRTLETFASVAETMAKAHDHSEDPRGRCIQGHLAHGFAQAAREVAGSVAREIASTAASKVVDRAAFASNWETTFGGRKATVGQA